LKVLALLWENIFKDKRSQKNILIMQLEDLICVYKQAYSHVAKCHICLGIGKEAYFL